MNDNAVRQIKIKIMNFGTPQEMIDEERDYYESIGEKPPRIGCLPFAIFIVIIFITCCNTFNVITMNCI
jgi:hypothetical protein